MAGASVIAIAALTVGFKSSAGSAVGGVQPFGPTAVTDSGAMGIAGSGESVRRCPSARAGLVFYRTRFSSHRRTRGVETEWPPGRKPRNCADAEYLAEVWASRSFAERRRTAYWLEHRFDAVVRKLERALAGSPMAGTGRDLEAVARRHHVSPYFIVAVAATESSIGRAACYPNRKNVWGLSSCGSGWYVPMFSTWAEAYEFFARYVNRQFPGHSTPYSFRGYAACSDCWARKVSSWMSSLFGGSTSTRYP